MTARELVRPGSPGAAWELRARASGWLDAMARMTDRLGLMPPLSVVVGLGLMIVALANTASRNGVASASLVLWLGLLLIIVPVAGRLLSVSPARSERVALVLLLGFALYVVKVLHSPDSFTLYDEFLHWRTSDVIMASGKLFEPNNILPASPFYPGLEIVTSALRSFGLPVFESGVLLIGTIRIVFVLALFLLYERVGGSSRLAGIATLIYMANPGFVFFDAQFSYESLALPIAVLVLWLVARRQGTRGWEAVSLTIAILLGIVAVTVTHHITSFALCAFLLLWSLVWIARRPPAAGAADGPVGPALMAVTAAFGWLLSVATVTVGYLAPAFDGALAEVIRLMAGETGGRTLFRSATGASPPPGESIMGYLAVGLVALAIPIGLMRIWRSALDHPTAVAMGIGALAYPASLIGRLTERGAEISARTNEFIFLPVAFVVAIAVMELQLPLPILRRTFSRRALARATPTRLGILATTALATVVAMGGLVLGVPFWARLPGPYLVSADPRSIEPQGILTAVWMRDQLGTGNRVMTDRVNRLLLGTYGQQHPISAVGDQVDVKAAFLSSTFLEADRRLLERARVRYVVIDRRLSSSLPMVGIYVERGELLAGPHRVPISPEALGKYDVLPEAARIYDSGDLQVYDVAELIDGAR